MLTRKVKLLILVLTGLALAACAKQPKYELPAPLMEDDSASGWRSY